MKNSKIKFLYTCMLSILFISSFNTNVLAADPKLVTTLDNAFGKIEDYIRYAQLKHREETGDDCAAGVLDAGKDPRVDY